MRRGEGAALATVLGEQIDRIAELTLAARARRRRGPNGRPMSSAPTWRR
jgi:uncharacterized protein YicC (UPF0701 family)